MDEASPPRYTVLHVDDDEDFLSLTQAQLERSTDDIDIVSVTDPAEAIEQLESTEFDCVVTDYKMDGLDGIEFLEAIRADDPDLPVIFFTGMGSEDIAIKAIKSGVTDYLAKSGDEKQFALLATRIRSHAARLTADREFKRAAALIEETYDRIPQGVLSLDRTSQVTYLNSHVAALLDSTDEELEGESLFRAVPELTGTMFQDELSTAMEEEVPTGGMFHLEELDVWLSFTVYPAGNGATVFLRDDTEFKRMEAENEGLREDLESSESRFRSLHAKISRPVPPFHL